MSKELYPPSGHITSKNIMKKITEPLKLSEIITPIDMFRCPKCGSKVLPSEIEGYCAQCLDCDEDFYEFELNEEELEE